MKKLGLILGFLPLAVYGILAGATLSSTLMALGAAGMTTILTGWSDLRKGMLLSWANLVMFGGFLAIIGVLGLQWIVPFMSILIYGTLTTVTIASMLAGRPFTLQYAREMVDPALWERPAFIQVNLLMTGVWGGVFAVNLSLSAVAANSPGFIGCLAQNLTYGMLALGILFTLWYPAHLKKKGQVS
jgi:hypothetical protein